MLPHCDGLEPLLQQVTLLHLWTRRRGQVRHIPHHQPSDLFLCALGHTPLVTVRSEKTLRTLELFPLVFLSGNVCVAAGYIHLREIILTTNIRSWSYLHHERRKTGQVGLQRAQGWRMAWVVRPTKPAQPAEDLYGGSDRKMTQ